MARTLDQILEERYEDIDPDGDFAQLLDLLTAGRDDSRLVEIVLDVYEKIQSAADPLAWLEEQRRALDLSHLTDAGQTPWGKLLLEDAKATGAYWKEQMETACDLTLEDPVLEKAYLPSLKETAQALEHFVTACAQGWDAAAERVVIPFPRLGSSRGVENRNRSKACGTAVKRPWARWQTACPAPAPACWRIWPCCTLPCGACSP